jgi:general L-amino acid transport system permease protein
MAINELQSTKKPPITQIGAILWLRTNLFSSWINGLLTLVSLYLLYISIPPLLNWMFLSANFNFGTVNIFGFNIQFSEEVGTNANCGQEGFCWPYIYEKFDMFIYGFYPREELWRPNVVFVLTALLFVIVRLVRNFRYKNIVLLSLVVIYPVVSYFLIAGGLGILPVVETYKWGGLLLTLIIAGVGIIVSFPIGVILALGRQSKLSAIRSSSIMYIEFIRAVPLITILFMASNVLPLFFESGTNIDKLMRALIAITLFQAAYMAEVVRGGLQAIPKGQYEAADAIGLSYFQKNILIILPQALKISIPNIVGSSISLFKDTTLVLIIGLMDFLSMVTTTTGDKYWLGRHLEGYIFVAMVMWVMLYTMSRYSKKLELRFNTENIN